MRLGDVGVGARISHEELAGDDVVLEVVEVPPATIVDGWNATLRFPEPLPDDHPFGGQTDVRFAGMSPDLDVTVHA